MKTLCAVLVAFALMPASGLVLGSEIQDSSPQGSDEGETTEKTQDETEELTPEEEQKAAEEEAKRRWLSKWGRFRLATKDITEWDFSEGMFRMRFGARYQLDFTAGNESPEIEALAGDIEENVEFRRARLFADGDFARRYHFRFEYDFHVDTGLKDAFISNLFRYKLKVVALRVGHFKEPFSLNRLTSANYNAFLEWALPVQTFAPGRSYGLAAYGHHRQARLTWDLGAFTGGQVTDDNRSTADLTFTGRITGLPQYKDDGRRLVHLGLSLSARKDSSGTAMFETRPEARFTPFFIGTGELPAEETQLAGLEGATVQGPFWLQAEVLSARPDVEGTGTLDFWGVYTEVGWFVTGEHRPYRRLDGTFGRLEPRRPYKKGGNPFKKGSRGGALEFAGRGSYIDLDDGPVQAGKMLDLSFAMNWYPTRATRFQFNYVRSSVKDSGHANVFLLRYQFNPGYTWPPLDPVWHHPDPSVPTVQD